MRGLLAMVANYRQSLKSQFLSLPPRAFPFLTHSLNFGNLPIRNHNPPQESDVKVHDNQQKLPFSN